MTFLPSSRPALVFIIGIMSMNWGVYTSHDTGHFSNQQNSLAGHVADILTIGCGEYEEFVFVLFPHLTTAPARTFFLSTYRRSCS